MYLSSLITDPEKLERMLSIIWSSLLPMANGALYYTVPLTILSFSFGIVLAVITALARISKNRFLSPLARAYVSIIRGTPLLVQLFIIFYGLPTLSIILDPFPAAIISFSLNVGAYASEIIRAAILSTPKGQWEAAHSIGMNDEQTLRRIILPQASRVSIPPLSNTFISLVKDTSLASLILVTELFRKAQEIAAQTYEFLYLYSEAAVLYWIICLGLSVIQESVEKRLNRYVA